MSGSIFSIFFLVMLFDYQFFMKNLFPILPELIITVCMLLVILVDLIQENSKWLFQISFVSLVAATIILLIQLYSICNGFQTPLQIDGFSIAFRTLLTLSSTICLLVSVEYIQRAGMQLAEFLIFVLTATIGGMFLCGANDLITIFVSLECLSLSSYLLAGYSKKDVRSNEAAMKYLLMGGASSSVLAYGFSWIYGLSGGELELTKLVSAVTNHTADSQGVWISFICILIGIGFKVAAVPFHQWTPDVYEGSPTPVVAFLSVGSKAAALAVAARILGIIFPSIQNQWQPIIEILALLSMIFGNLIATTQTSMKRMLAYSSISQAGYLFIGIVSSTNYGYTSIIVYLLTYLFMNLGAFGCVIIFGLKTGTDQIRDYTGLYFKDPWLTFCLSIFLLSLAGIPPLAGFFGKLYLFWSGWKSEFYLLVYVAIATSVVSIYYYLRVIKVMLTKETKEQSSYVENYSSFSLSIVPTSSLEFGITLCVFFSIILGFILDILISITNQVVLSSQILIG